MSPAPKKCYQKLPSIQYRTKVLPLLPKGYTKGKKVGSVMNRAEKRPTVSPNPKCLRSCDYLDLKHFSITF